MQSGDGISLKYSRSWIMESVIFIGTLFVVQL
jgi:hypothetical protein